MAINDFNIGFLGKLDGTRSKNQINQDIEALKKSLNSLEIKATLDPKQKNALEKQINLLQVSLSDASFSPKALNDLVSQVNNALKGIQINIPNINTSTAGKSATQAGQQIGKLVSDSAEKAIGGVSSKGIGKYFRIDENTSNEFRSQMQNLVKEWTNAKGEMTDLKIDTRTFYDKDTEENVERLHQATVTYKNDLDEVIKKTIAWRQIGEQPVFDTAGSPVLNKDGSQQMEAIRGFVEVSGQYSKALEKTSIAADNFADKQVKLQTSLANSLNSIKSAVSDQNSSKPIKDQSNISSLQSQYQIVEQAIANVGNASKYTYAQMEADARTQISVLQDMVKQYRNAENVATSLRTKDFSTVKDVQVQKLQEFKDKISGSNVSIAQMQSDLNNLDTALNGAFDAKTLTDYLNQLDVAQAKFQQLNTQIASANRNEKVQIKVDGLQSNINEFAQLSTEANNFKTTVNGVEVSVQSLTSDLKNVKSQGDFSVVNEKWKSFSSAAKAAGLSVINVTSNITKMATEQRRLSQAGSMQKWLQNNSKATKQFGNEINTMVAKLRSADDMTVPELEKIRAEFQKIQISAREANKIGFSFTDSIKNQAAKFTQWVSLSSLIMSGVHAIGQMKEKVYELDSSLLELSKVSDLSAEGLAKVTDQAYELGDKVGKTGTQVIDAVTEFKRAGYEISQSMEMAKSALVMTNVAEGIDNTAESAGILISVLKGFNMEASQTTKIIDSINSTANQSPIGFDELAEGLQRTSGTLSQTGTSLEQTIGLLTAGFAQLRNIEKVSTSLITLSARLRGVDEDGEIIEGLSASLQDEFGKIGVAIEDSEGNLRNLYDIMKDYSKVLPTLTSKQKQWYSGLAAGKRNVASFNAITQQFADAEKATAQAIDSVGSAAEENAKYLDSIQGKTADLKSIFQELSQTTISDDFLKGAIEGGTTFISILNEISKLIGGLGGLLGAGGGIALNKMLGLLKETNLTIGKMVCEAQ